MGLIGSSGAKDETQEFATTLGRFLATLGAVIRSSAEWLGLVVLDAASSGTDTVADQAGTVAGGTRSTVKTIRKKTRNTLLKLALVATFVWWLDRDLSEGGEA